MTRPTTQRLIEWWFDRPRRQEELRAFKARARTGPRAKIYHYPQTRSNNQPEEKHDDNG